MGEERRRTNEHEVKRRSRGTRAPLLRPPPQGVTPPPSTERAASTLGPVLDALFDAPPAGPRRAAGLVARLRRWIDG